FALAAAKSLPAIAGPTVGGDSGIRFHIRFDEAPQRLFAGINAVPHSYSTGVLCPDEDDLLVRCAATDGGPHSREDPLGKTPNETLVELHCAAQLGVLARVHRCPQLVQPSPCRFIRAKTEDALQILGADAVLARDHLPDRAKPQAERLTCTLERRTGGEAR